MSARIIAITMPKWGIEMTEGTVNGWTAEIGQSVARTAGLLDVETEKIVNTVEAPAEGILRRRLVEAGDVRAVGSLIGVLADATVSDAEIDAYIASFRGAVVSYEPEGPRANVQVAPLSGASSTLPEADANSGESRVSPIARRLAEKLGVDVAQIHGTGRNGRVSKEDVEAFAATARHEPKRVRMSATRLAIARRVLEATQTVPHYRVARDVNADPLRRRRVELNTSLANSAVAGNITLNDLLLRACALALKQHPELNAHLVAEEILQFDTVDLSIAVATAAGILTPVLRSADAKSVAQISSEAGTLARQATAGQLRREDLLGGSFMVSNLGMLGVSRFDAILNPPQVAALAVGAAEARAVIRDGQVVAGHVLSLTLSLDHRVVDGARAAAFLATLAALIEQPEALQ